MWRKASIALEWTIACGYELHGGMEVFGLCLQVKTFTKANLPT